MHIFQFQSNASFLQKAENKSGVLDVFVRRLQNDNCIAQIHNGKLPLDWRLYYVHDAREGGGCIF